MTATDESYGDRIERLADEAAAVRAELDPDPPDDDRAMALCREGLGPTVALYCEARTGDGLVRFSDQQFQQLQTALDDWLAAYGSCYGVEIDGDGRIREAAELLVDTHNASDVAQVLTGVPERG